MGLSREMRRASSGVVCTGGGTTAGERTWGAPCSDVGERVACAGLGRRGDRAQQRTSTAKETTHGRHAGGGRKSGNSAAKESAASGGPRGRRYKERVKGSNVTGAAREKRDMGRARWPTLGIQKATRSSRPFRSIHHTFGCEISLSEGMSAQKHAQKSGARGKIYVNLCPMLM